MQANRFQIRLFSALGGQMIKLLGLVAISLIVASGPAFCGEMIMLRAGASFKVCSVEPGEQWCNLVGSPERIQIELLQNHGLLEKVILANQGNDDGSAPVPFVLTVSVSKIDGSYNILATLVEKQDAKKRYSVSAKDVAVVSNLPEITGGGGEDLKFGNLIVTPTVVLQGAQ
jgi:hypothetical protein